MKKYLFRFLAVTYYAYTIGQIVQIVGTAKQLRTEVELVSAWEGVQVAFLLFSFILITALAVREYYQTDASI